MGENAIHTCCICRVTFKGWGNNPAPFPCDDEGRCCNDCNERFVIPARLAPRRIEPEEYDLLFYFAHCGRQFVNFTTKGTVHEAK